MKGTKAMQELSDGDDDIYHDLEVVVEGKLIRFAFSWTEFPSWGGAHECYCGDIHEPLEFVDVSNGDARYFSPQDAIDLAHKILELAKRLST